MIDNLTPFGAAAAFAYDLDDRQVAVLCVAARFNMPRAGAVQDSPLQASDEQPPPPMGDVHWSGPATSSLRMPGQAVPRRPYAEVYAEGSAWAPRGRPVTEMRTQLRVGDCRKDLSIIGDRYWQAGLAGVRPSAPRPFTSMPLRYERSFGGTVTASDGRVVAQEPRNPIGRGMYPDARVALDQPLPNFEKPGERMAAWSDRLTPWGYGPVPGAWQPRLGWAGTYDEHWVASRLPLWPKDTDARFFCAAAGGLILDSPINGGIVALDGFHPDGPIAFRLPELRVIAKSYYENRVERRAMRLEAISIDTERHTITLFWRAVAPIGRGKTAHHRSVVRVLERWESSVT